MTLMTSHYTSASHKIFCPIKCSLESTAFRPQMDAKAANWSLLHTFTI